MSGTLHVRCSCRHLPLRRHVIYYFLTSYRPDLARKRASEWMCYLPTRELHAEAVLTTFTARLYCFILAEVCIRLSRLSCSLSPGFQVLIS